MTNRISPIPIWLLFILTSGVIALENLADFRLSMPYMLKACGSTEASESTFRDISS
jgi:hypothetical protein